MSTIIEDIVTRKIFNSRGEETLEVDVITVDGFGSASAPAGASRGSAEVVPYPKGGVDFAIRKIEEEIAPELIGMNADEQETIDLLLHEIDETNNFRNIGGNTVCAISLSTAEAAASSYGIPLFQHLAGSLASNLPYPLGNVLGGGEHAGGKASDIQEFLVLPLNASTFSDAAKANIMVHQKVCSILEKKDSTFTGGKGDEGGWAPNIRTEDALKIMVEACKEVSNELDLECRVGVDIAASTLWNSKENSYVYASDGVNMNPEEQLDYMLHLIEKYHLIYVEDPFHEDDFEGFAQLTKRVKNCLICGDDLFVTNKERLAHGVMTGSANAIIIKTNQIGTLTDAWETVRLAIKNHYTPIMSHRSGETTDTHLAHLAVAFYCPIIKSGVVGGERVAKINELIRIEESLGNRGKMSNLSF
ncbi:phosphopyruvate hydratase [Candidatus Bathyarchaeota archaeon]|nr:phosphopyruvate hydratase [Candidatus Bathyarchaeota archaeon]